MCSLQVKSISCGPATFAVAAVYPQEKQQCVMTWGAATNGELGYGALGKNSSANPDKVPSQQLLGRSMPTQNQCLLHGHKLSCAALHGTDAEDQCVRV
jgi:hypothetical protein